MKWKVPLGLTFLIILGAFFPYASPVRYAVTEHLAAGYHWHFPWTYVLLAPFCSLADMLTVMSMREMIVFLSYGFVGLLFFPARIVTKSFRRTSTSSCSSNASRHAA